MQIYIICFIYTLYFLQNSNQIILYRPNDTISLEVRLENETVWLTANQMAILFDRDEKTIRKHINNVFNEDEVPQINNTHFLRVDGVKQAVAFYTLDVVISVGYRVKSKQGVIFRQWANKVLKEYLLKGYTLNSRIMFLEQKVAEHSEKIDFFVRTALPPTEGVFHDGKIFDAYKFATDLIKSAKIYTSHLSDALKLDVQKHNQQYPPIEIEKYTKAHDRFLIIDDTDVYHIGASLKDLGKKLFAFSKLNISPKTIL